MIDLQTYVIILLLIAFVGMFYIFRVIKKQIELFKLPIDDHNVRYFRYILFAISVVIVATGLIPICINLYTLIGPETGRPHTVSLISLIYSLGVHLQSLLLSYLLWLIYRVANSDDNK